MQQKTTWIHYSIIGISILVLNLSCSKGEIDNSSTDTYTYKNQSGKNVLLKIYNTINNSSEEYSINYGDSKSFICKGNPGTAPFYTIDGSLITSNLIEINFEDNKCLSFERDISDGITPDDGEGLFNVTNYDNYATDFIGKSNYHLNYTISVDMYNQSETCN
jgi:hypothetical protein